MLYKFLFSATQLHIKIGILAINAFFFISCKIFQQYFCVLSVFICIFAHDYHTIPITNK